MPLSILQQILLTAHPLGVAPHFVSAEVGTVNATTVAVTFDENVSASDYAAGVTIKVNGSTATISSATRQTDHKIVYYVLSAAVVYGDTVTWEYAKASGNIVGEIGGVALADVSAQSVTNNVAFTPLTGISNPIVGFDKNSVLYQDSARTTLATAANDPVGSWSDLVGTNHANQATAGLRPLLKLNPYAGATKALLFDGSDDVLATASIAHGIGTGDFYAAMVIRMSASATNYKTIFDSSNAAAYINGTKVNLYLPSDNVGATVIATDTRYIIEINRSGTSLKYWINGTQDANTFTNSTSIVNGVQRIGFSGSSPEYWPGYIEAIWLYKTTPTAAQQAAMRAYYGF